MPEDRPIYFAVDFDAAGPEVLEYFKGIRNILPVNRIGVYGGLRAVRYLHNNERVKWVWQTYAWSGGLWHTTTHVRQYHNNISVGGVDCDANRALMPDFGQWMPGKSPTTPQQQKETEVQHGQLKNGPEAHDMISIPLGSATNIAFACDNGLFVLPAAKLRVAMHDKDGWLVKQIDVSGIPTKTDANIQSMVKFRDAKTTGAIGITRLDDGKVDVAWEIS